MSTPKPFHSPLKMLLRTWLQGITPSALIRGLSQFELGPKDEASAESQTVVTLPVHPVFLNFQSRELESDYRVTITRRYAPYIRIAVFLSTSLIIWFAAIDWYYMNRSPEAYQLSLILRATVMLPAALSFFFFTFSARYETSGSQAAALAMFFINSCWAFPTVIGGSSVVEYFSSAMIQTLLFGTFLLNIRFVHVLIMSWASLALYWLLVWSTDIPLDQKVYVTIELGVINQMLCFALYLIERLLRQSYFQQKVIESINAKRVDWLETMTVFLRHELKNKIVGIRSSLELIQLRHTDEQTQAYLRRGITNITTMSDILSHTSEATSIEASLYSEKRQIFDLSECVSDQIDAFRNVSGDNTIDYYPANEAIPIFGIEHRIKELFENLLFNALDHASDGTRVTVRLGIASGLARISVINQGETLPEQHQAIYRLFETDRKNVHGESNNVGLGLYLVKLIATAHDGSVQGMNLADNSGVEFSVYLPISVHARA